MSTLPEILINLLDVLLEKILMITGTWMEIVNCQIREPDSQDLLF